MKSKILMMVALMAAMISGCGKESGRGGQSMDGAQTVTFNMLLDPGISTRADGAPTRYVVETYNDGGTTLESHVESSLPSVAVKLLPAGRYEVYCFADYGTPNAASGVNDYDVSSVRYFKVAQGKTPSKPAYSGTTPAWITDNQPSVWNVNLKHAVAMVNFVQKDNFANANNKLKVTFNSVYSGLKLIEQIFEEGGSPKTAVYEFDNIGQNVAGQTIATSYIIAKLDAESSPGATVIDMVIDFNDGDVTSLTNVPFNNDKRTNIRGSFSNQYSLPVDITSDGEWSTDLDSSFPASPPNVGDFYYSDGTYSTTLKANKTCKGIVFWVNPDDKTKGKAISVGGAPGYALAWSYSSNLVFIGATSDTDGRANQDVAVAMGSLYLYPAMDWCEGYVQSQDWYLPAIKELTEQLAPVFSMVNDKIRLVSGGVIIGSQYMWSSTEVDDANAKAATNVGNNGTASIGNMKKDSHQDIIEVRAVRSF